MYFCDNVYDAINDRSVAFDKSPSVKTWVVRMELKPGVKEFYNAMRRYTIHEDLGSEVSDDESRHVTIVIRGDLSDKVYSHILESASDYSRMLSQVKTLYDPIPELIVFSHHENITIDSVDFEAHKGIFSTHATSFTFNGSTFKKAPRIYSDYAMSKMLRFPPYDKSDRVYAPFKNALNVEAVEQQGELAGETVIHLGPCDFSYWDEYGRALTDAWPRVSGEFNGSIERYITSDYIDVSSAPILFEKIGANCKVVHKPFDCEALILAYQGNYNLPIFGLSFEDCEDMEHLRLTDAEFFIDVDLDSDSVREAIEVSPESDLEELNERLNIQFSWSALGIQAPKRCRRVEGLHTIYANFFKTIRESPGDTVADHKMTHVTPGALENIIYTWGKSLSDAWTDDFKMDKNNVPLMPDGVEYLSDYYYRKIGGVDTYVRERLPAPREAYEKYDLSIHTSLGDWRTADSYTVLNDRMGRTLIKDGVDWLPQIPLDWATHMEGDNIAIINYARNTYAHLNINEDITIPAPPEATRHLLNCYFGTFAHAQGMHRREIVNRSEYDLTTIVCVSSYDTGEFPGNNKGEVATYKNYLFGHKEIDKRYSYNGRFLPLFNSRVTNGIKIRQMQGLTAKQKSEFSEDVARAVTPVDRLKSVIRMFTGEPASIMQRQKGHRWGMPSTLVAMVPGVDAKNPPEPVKLLDKINSKIDPDIFFNKKRNEILNTPYKSYPSTTPASVLEHEVASEDELRAFLESFASPKDDSSIFAYEISNHINVANVDMPNLVSCANLMYKMYYLSDVNLEDGASDYVFRVTSNDSLYCEKYMYMAFITFPPSLRDGSPNLIFETYFEAGVSPRDYLNSGDVRDFEKKNKHIDEDGNKVSDRLQVGVKATFVLSKKNLSIEEKRDFKHDLTNIVNQLPTWSAGRSSRTNRYTLYEAFNKEMISQSETEAKELLSTKISDSDTVKNAITKTLTIGAGTRTNRLISYTVSDWEPLDIKAKIKGVSPVKSPYIKQVDLSDISVTNDLMFSIYNSNINYKRLDLDDKNFRL